MHQRVLNKLEYHKVLERLKSCCTCGLAQEISEGWIPSVDVNEIKHWQQETAEAREIIRLEPQLPLGGIWDIRSALWKAEIGGILEPTDLLEVASTLSASRRLKHFLATRIISEQVLAKKVAKLGVFFELEQKIEKCIGDQGEVKDTASTDLLRIRCQINTFQVRVREKLDSILRQSDLQKYLQESIVTIRGDRYVVPVKQECRHQFPGVVHDQSASGATVFIEPLAVVQINNEIRRLQVEEREEVRRILKELTVAIGGQVVPIRETLDNLAGLDFIFARAKLGYQMDGIKPELNLDGWLDIRQGRHPLIPGKAVPLSVNLGKDFDALVVTGPNTGGKTVALKTIGLLTLMAQAGLQVPAEPGTCLGVFDGIFVDIGDEQSIEQSLSTFSSHMTNIIEILHQLRGRCLVLLDELGAGTDPTEGSALAMAILEYLLEQGARTVATTHYSELKVFAFNRARVENAAVEFDVETLRPTYRLLIGLPGRSNAFEIAARLGLDPYLVERARGYLTTEELQVSDLIQDLKETQQKSEADRQEAEKMRQRQERKEEELGKRQEAWREKETLLFQRAHEEALEIVRQARLEADQILRNLRQMHKETVNQETLKKAQAERERLRQHYSESYDAWTQVAEKVADHLEKTGNVGERIASAGPLAATVKPGNSVLIPRLNQRGYVLKAPTTEGEVEVQLGIIKLKVPLSDVRLITEKKESESYTVGENYSGVSQLMAHKTLELNPEVHLRGMLVDEALVELEKYLDDAYLAGMAEVRVIHGKGTGALRSAVQHYLSSHPHVKSHRLGGYHEGGIGVTVVQLKK
ncbi:MAG: endonuclease MutS2 [Syntrophomonadaceae bacterium]|nr:endonuclease MutS2 [Syntrophomonadaceae bacterium]